MEKASDIGFIILTYYPDRPRVSALIDALLPHQIILVDNTPDQSRPFHSVVYLANKKNMGYTGGVNRGLHYAVEKGFSWAVIVNDDLELTKSIVKTFVDHLTKANPGLAGAYPRSLDAKRWTTSTTETPVDFLSGSFLAVHRDVIQTIGYLYDPYFIFYEEVEYCIRAKKAGFPLQTIKLSGITHEESSTFKTKPFLHQYYLARNHLLFVERNAPVFVKLYELIRFPRTIFEHMKRQEWGAIEGIRDYIFRRFGPHRKS
jgi:GT2 family glycosyltransferase